VGNRGERASCVPGRLVSTGNSRSLMDTSPRLLTCATTGDSVAAHVLLSSRSHSPGRARMALCS
jgi:hypothetical protein